jgi:hypothetical protein
MSPGSYNAPGTLAKDPMAKYVLSGTQVGYPGDRHFGFTCRLLARAGCRDDWSWDPNP